MVRHSLGKLACDPATVASSALDPRCQHEQGLLPESEATVSSPRVETTQKPSGFILLAVLIFPSQSFLFLSYCALCLFLQSSLTLSANEIKYKNKTVIPCHGWVAKLNSSPRAGCDFQGPTVTITTKGCHILHLALHQPPLLTPAHPHPEPSLHPLRCHLQARQRTTRFSVCSLRTLGSAFCCTHLLAFWLPVEFSVYLLYHVFPPASN